MIFSFTLWQNLCRELADKGICSITASAVLQKQCKEPYLVLKHDVETNVRKAYRMAEIESRHGHRGVYYVQAYLMDAPHNIRLLKQTQKLGHEISYHYDVMDSSKGNLEAAIVTYEENKRRFEENGFLVRTVCQHGYPVI